MFDSLLSSCRRLFTASRRRRRWYSTLQSLMLICTLHLCAPLMTAKSMKPGGLRLFLSLHLMGQQNTPNKGSWKALQMEDGAALDMIFNDESGSLVLRFLDNKIAVDRVGKSPSLQYLIQESVILQGFLDELNTICFEGDVEEGNRLLVLDEPGDWIERARGTASFS